MPLSPETVPASSAMPVRPGQSQRRAAAFRHQYATLDQTRDYAAGLAVPGADDAGGIAARQLAAIKHGLEDRAGFRRQAVEADFLFGP